MTKEDALWDVMDATRETARAKQSGLTDLSEYKTAWRNAVQVARELGATQQEISQEEREGQSW